jgi:hypothetical protein
MLVAVAVLYMVVERLVLAVLAEAEQVRGQAPAHQVLPTQVVVVEAVQIVNLAATAALAS